MSYQRSGGSRMHVEVARPTNLTTCFPSCSTAFRTPSLKRAKPESRYLLGFRCRSLVGLHMVY